MGGVSRRPTPLAPDLAPIMEPLPLPLPRSEARPEQSTDWDLKSFRRIPPPPDWYNSDSTDEFIRPPPGRSLRSANVLSKALSDLADIGGVLPISPALVSSLLKKLIDCLWNELNAVEVWSRNDWPNEACL